MCFKLSLVCLLILVLTEGYACAIIFILTDSWWGCDRSAPVSQHLIRRLHTANDSHRIAVRARHIGAPLAAIQRKRRVIGANISNPQTDKTLREVVYRICGLCSP